MQYQEILDAVHATVSPLVGCGRVADYIPELAPVNPRPVRIGPRHHRWRCTGSAMDMVGGVADAVVIPGAMFGPAAGLLTYAAAVAERRAATVHRHSWSHPPPDPFEPHIEDWVRDEISPLLDAVGGKPMLIAKSLGTNAAAIAADRRLPAVWLTPILTLPWVTAALNRATAPFLVVGGTADDMWDATLARRLSPYVLEI
jgi:hypothetical protein